MKKWYEKLFENYSEQYDNEVFTKGTKGECDFIEKEIDFDKNLNILDVGCGTGRHAIELAQIGYNVTGIDLSENQLKRGRQKAEQLGLQIEFIKMDAREITFERKFDLALMICEGAFPLMETDEMNFQIIQSIAKALKPRAKMIMTTLNGLFPIYNSINEFHGQNNNDTNGLATYLSESFDLMTFRDYNATTFTDDDGVEHAIECSERYYIPPEITWLLKSAGFDKVEIFGASLGAFSRNDKLSIRDFEMLIVAEKQLQD